MIFISNIISIKKYRYLMSILIKKDIKKKYKDSVLGILWSLLNPLLIMIVLMIIFSKLFGRQIDNFPVYLLTGKLLFDFFVSSTNMGMRSMIHSAGLIKKVPVPKFIFTLSKVLSSFVFFLISLIILVVVMVVTQNHVSLSILYIPVYLLLFLGFCFGVSLILATIMVFFRDIEHLYGVFTVVLNFASAIFYPATIISDKYMFILKLNPVYYYIDGFRQIVYFGKPVDFANLIMCFLLALVSILIGMLVFEKNEDKFIHYV